MTNIMTYHAPDEMEKLHKTLVGYDKDGESCQLTAGLLFTVVAETSDGFIVTLSDNSRYLIEFDDFFDDSTHDDIHAYTCDECGSPIGPDYDEPLCTICSR